MNDETGPKDELAVPEPWIPPAEYQYGPIPGVPSDIAACMPDRGMVHEYVWWATQCTYASPIYHIGAILPVLTWQLASRGWSFGERGKQIALQSFLIGESSSGKSTCLRMAKQFHEDLLSVTSHPYWDRPPLPPDTDARTRQIQEENAERTNPWILAAGTAPGLLEQLFDRFNPHTNTTPAILYNEEVAHLLERKKDYAISSVLLELFDALPKVERHLSRYREMAKKGQQPPSVVRAPAVSGLFAGTPISLKDKLDASAFEGGLVSRSLWISGQPDLDRWFLTDRKRVAARQFVLGRWIDYGHHHLGLEVGANVSRIIDLPMPVKRIGAELLFPAFAQSMRDSDSRLSAVRGRALEHAELIAGVFAWSKGQSAVLEADMRAAAHLLRWSIRSVERIAHKSILGTSWDQIETVLGIIRSAGDAGIRKSALYPEVRLPKKDLDQAIETLLDQGIVVEVIQRHDGPGRPAKVYRLASSRKIQGEKVIDFAKALKRKEEE
jgi:hypothetical protein